MTNEYDFDSALNKLCSTKRNILITGPGGTGKTTLIRRFIESISDSVVLCASTGTAAVNIGGITAHRLFGIPVPAYGARVTSKQDSAVKTVSAADVIVIDEISMLTNDAFSFLWRVLKKAEKAKGSKIRLVVVGDFLQLPPVVTKTDAKFLKKFGLDVSGWCFACKEWQDASFLPIVLTEIKRQDEPEYINHLNAIRTGSIKGIDWFSSRITADADLPKDAIYICGTNAEADRINNERLSELDTAFSAYQSTKSGRVANAPMDNIVAVKPGERVMFTVNSSEPGVYQNGLMGTVDSCYRDDVVVMTDDGRKIAVHPYMWHLYSYKATGGILSRNEVGTFSQIPLKPAYAITIHKSQGKTFDRAVISPVSFAPGQLYVALSRVRSFEGLYLTSEIKPEYIMADATAEKFISNGYSYDLPKPVKKTAVKKTTTKRKTSATKKTTTKRKTSAKTPAVKCKATAKRKTTAKKPTAKRKTATKRKKAD